MNVWFVLSLKIDISKYIKEIYSQPYLNGIRADLQQMYYHDGAPPHKKCEKIIRTAANSSQHMALKDCVSDLLNCNFFRDLFLGN